MTTLKWCQNGANLDVKFRVLAPSHSLTPQISTVVGTFLAPYSVWDGQNPIAKIFMLSGFQVPVISLDQVKQIFENCK